MIAKNPVCFHRVEWTETFKFEAWSGLPPLIDGAFW
jgi:hypothetical protein